MILASVEAPAILHSPVRTPAAQYCPSHAIHTPPPNRSDSGFSYSTILYSTLLYSTLLYSTLLYSTLLYSTLLYSTILYCTILYSTLLYSTILYYTVLHSTLLYSTILYYTILGLYKEAPPAASPLGPAALETPPRPARPSEIPGTWGTSGRTTSAARWLVHSDIWNMGPRNNTNINRLFICMY